MSKQPGFIDEVLRAPVYLFQMGKVGSSSLEATLGQHLKGAVIHAHNHESMPVRAQRLLRWRRRVGLPVYVICPVREPISRNVSAFFQNFERDTGLETSDRPWTVAELVALFLRCYRHNICLEWFDRHFRTTFGVDVFAHPFPLDQKWTTYRRGALRILLFRSDLDHAGQLAVVSRFLGREINEWHYANRAEDKAYRHLYREFCVEGRLPELYLSFMGRSRFCQHFWSQEEIAANARKWRE